MGLGCRHGGVCCRRRRRRRCWLRAGRGAIHMPVSALEMMGHTICIARRKSGAVLQMEGREEVWLQLIASRRVF